jgi:hypothetical protein
VDDGAIRRRRVQSRRVRAVLARAHGGRRTGTVHQRVRLRDRALRVGQLGFSAARADESRALIAQYTDIAIAPEGVYVDLGSPLVFRYPFLFLTGHLPVRFTAAEADNLKAYVERGGFIFIDDHNHDIDGAFHRTVTAELARIFGPGALIELPNDHELYRAFFEFEDGPPTTSHELNGWGDGLIHEHLHAIEVNGRIGVLYSNKDYASEWNYHADNKRFLGLDNTRFGVNVIVYALTR